MIENKKIYLYWKSFTLNEVICLGFLEKISDIEEKYRFVYNLEEAIKARKAKCYLPFTEVGNDYILNEYHYDYFPDFFERRAPLYKPEYQNMHPMDVVALTHGISIKDNFIILNESDHIKFSEQINKNTR